ncbi:hypothetical protein GFER_06065 [Geoalkalibacter ferrihydriticus DSM 17813]|uniref:Uncharacterized protein n=1 Tax=Geoalkalibacter ferrihydriticus DSM 17813 TaxID=1121915 RepID=A0A0C2EHN9_9BACT|nr:hypothetical protein [Geoalkalibacter ferrihydriticus]KIH78133.1 hypothetical protein GFER_06065 [Geoalkalibacter ferrihydriticus DSM 17813]
MKQLRAAFSGWRRSPKIVFWMAFAILLFLSHATTPERARKRQPRLHPGRQFQILQQFGVILSRRLKKRKKALVITDFVSFSLPRQLCGNKRRDGRGSFEEAVHALLDGVGMWLDAGTA